MAPYSPYTASVSGAYPGRRAEQVRQLGMGWSSGATHVNHVLSTPTGLETGSSSRGSPGNMQKGTGARRGEEGGEEGGDDGGEPEAGATVGRHGRDATQAW